MRYTKHTDISMSGSEQTISNKEEQDMRQIVIDEITKINEINDKAYKSAESIRICALYRGFKITKEEKGMLLKTLAKRIEEIIK